MDSKLRELCEKYGVEPVSFNEGRVNWEVLHHSPVADLVRHGRPQALIGTTGTDIWNGDVNMETNPSYQPSTVRGSWGNSGLFEELYRTEPQIFDAVQSHTETLVTGTWELQMPERVPDDKKEQLQEAVAYHGARFKGIYSGWDNFIEHAASFLIFGFAPFEIQWMQGERPYVHDILFREQTIVHRWHFDADMCHLTGLECQTGVGSVSTDKSQFIIPATGKRLTDSRLLLCNLAARGNNVEGISPIRPAIHYIKFKQLLMQIAAVMSEKYGIPLVYVYEEESAQQDANIGDSEEMDDVYDVVKAINALNANVAALPGNLRVGVLSLNGTMPDFKSLIDYCDQMILTTFSNEGSLLGLQGSVGSYALGEVKERKSLASAPFYARRIARPLNAIVRKIIRSEMGELPEYPTWSWRMDGLQDTSKWLADVVSVFPNKDITSYPPAIQQGVLEKLGFGPDALEYPETKQTVRDLLEGNE